MQDIISLATASTTAMAVSTLATVLLLTLLGAVTKPILAKMWGVVEIVIDIMGGVLHAILGIALIGDALMFVANCFSFVWETICDAISKTIKLIITAVINLIIGVLIAALIGGVAWYFMY